MSSQQIGVVEVQGQQAGWLALQAGIATAADVILIPEQPIDLDAVAEYLRGKMSVERPFGLVVVAEGIELEEATASANDPSPMQASLSPLASGESTGYAIQKSGRAAKIVANRLQLKLAEKTYPLVLGPWARGGRPTATDRVIAKRLSFGSILAAEKGATDCMLAWEPSQAVGEATPDRSVRVVPLGEVLAETEKLLDGSSPVTRARVKLLEEAEGILAL